MNLNKNDNDLVITSLFICIRFIVLIGDWYNDRCQGHLSTAIFSHLTLPHFIHHPYITPRSPLPPPSRNEILNLTQSFIRNSLFAYLFHLIIIIGLPCMHAGNAHTNGNNVLHISKLHRSPLVVVVVIDTYKFVIHPIYVIITFSQINFILRLTFIYINLVKLNY